MTDAFAATPTFVPFALPCRHTLQTGQVLHGPRRCVVMFKEGNTSLKTCLGLGCIPVLTRCHIESAPSVPEPRTRTEVMHYCTKICLDSICPKIFKILTPFLLRYFLATFVCVCHPTLLLSWRRASNASIKLLSRGGAGSRLSGRWVERERER